jgi:hypothetical protein
VALSFLYRLIRRAIEVLSLHRMDTVAKDADILVLRVRAENAIHGLRPAL